MNGPQDDIINRSKDQKGNTALHELCSKQGVSEAMIDELLAQGADINRQNLHGMTPLGIAVLNGHYNVAKCLLKNGADIFLTTEKGATFNALHIACTKGGLMMVELLMEYGAAAHVNQSGISYDGRDTMLPCLHSCIAHSNTSLVDILLSAGAHVNQIGGTHQKNAPIHLAAQHSTPSVIRKLLNAGADIQEVQPNTGFTPLHIAIDAGRSANVDYLLAAGADVNAMDAKGHTLLILAARKNATNFTKQLLQMPGIDIDSQMPKPPHRTALMYAAEQGYVEIARLLLSHGANASLTDAFNNTASAIAKQNRYESVSQIIRIAEDHATTRHFDEIYQKHKKPGRPNR